jgi:hypothetical protein
LANREITTGDGLGNFGPNTLLTRDAFAAFLFRYHAEPWYDPPSTPIFADVPRTQRFYKEITWLAENGITTGWTQGNQRFFGPNETLTRADTAAFLYRYVANVRGAIATTTYTPPVSSPFADVGTSHQFYKPIAWMKDNAITTGSVYNGRLQYAPTATTKRFEIAAFLHRFDLIS